MTRFELTWKRSARLHPDGEPMSWVATDSRQALTVVYAVRRDPDAPRGHQWTLTAWTGSFLREKQIQTGFDLKFTAQQAALATRCHICGRFAPFATVERSGSSDGWRCRDRDGCAATEAEKAALAAEVTREILDTDLAEIGVTDTADGPELIFVRDGTGNRITVVCTETDLARLFRVLARRLRYRAMADIAALIGQCDALLAAHDDDEQKGSS